MAVLHLLKVAGLALVVSLPAPVGRVTAHVVDEHDRELEEDREDERDDESERIREHREEFYDEGWE